MKIILLSLLLLSDSTGFTAKDAMVLSQNSLTSEQQKVYDYIKSRIYQQAEKRQLWLTLVIQRKMFASVYDWRTNAQTWSLLLPVKRRLELELFIVDMKIDGKDEIVFEVKW